MKRAKLTRIIHNNWDTIVEDARMPYAYDSLPDSLSLLGSGFKTDKGIYAVGVLTGICYMAPAGEAFEDNRTLCPMSTAGCRATCLGAHSGQLAMTHAERSRLWKTALYMGWRPGWDMLMDLDILRIQRRAAQAGLRAAVRVDGSSDTGRGRKFAEAHPTVSFYDYTKVLSYARRQLDNPLNNYHVTLSYAGTPLSRKACVDYLYDGGNVAVVFDTPKGQKLPDGWEDFEVVDGDEHDARFLDNGSQVIGLRFKTARKRAEMLAKAGSFVERVW